MAVVTALRNGRQVLLCQWADDESPGEKTGRVCDLAMDKLGGNATALLPLQLLHFEDIVNYSARPRTMPPMFCARE